MQTVHSGLKIPVKKKSTPNADGSEMSNNAKNDLQRRMAGVDYILVDEMSMVGQDLLGLMSIRGRQAVQGRPIEGDDDRHLGMFGGLNVILVGDPMQLPPVGASPMWSDKPGTSGHTVEGRAVWLAINAAVELTEVMRQMGEENAAFRRALLAVAEGRATQEHFDLFVSRMRSVVPEAEHARFLEAVHLFPTNAKADDWNWTRLNNLRTPIALIRAKHSVSPGYANVSADRFRGLDPHLYLAVGARVFITSNVWTSAGLANGATGIIIHIDWAAGGDSIRPPGVPAVLYVKLKDFKGPQYFTVASRVINGQTVDLEDVVPIAPIEAQDERGPAANASGQRGARCVRRQLPVRLAFGVTHHKSQGGTLDVVVLDLGERENNDGQSFTALSRCRDLQNMLLEDFTLERLTAIGDSPSFAARLAALDRLRDIENDTRLKFGLTLLERSPRPERSCARSGGRSSIRGRGRGIRGRGRQGPRGRSGRGSSGGGRGRGRQSGRRGAGGTAMVTWELYALQAIAASSTNSWFYVPLLLEALGRPATAFRFQRPPLWDTYVERYRGRFAHLNPADYVTPAGNYIVSGIQDMLMSHDDLGLFIFGWIQQLRISNSVVDLPSVNFDG